MHAKKERVNIKRIRAGLRTRRPRTKEHLQDYIETFLNVKIPDRVLTVGHNSPIDYLWYAFNSDFDNTKKANADCIVWANRGGGKTQLAGIVTLLDCIFKPNIQIRILSGSGYQAGRMYEYFSNFLDMGFRDSVALIIKSPTDKTVFLNGATVEVLKQSETNVRGPHVHKLRCDEVELFKKKVFEAAQYTTMSSNKYLAALECISTMHRPFGLMSKLVKDADKLGKPVFKWNLWDVIEKCKGRECKHCPLTDFCGEKAKKGRGYFKIDDAITQLGRTNASSFGLEMLCGDYGKKKGGLWDFRERVY